MIRPHPKVTQTETSRSIRSNHVDTHAAEKEIVRLIRKRDVEVLRAIGDPSQLRELAPTVEGLVEEVLKVAEEMP